MNCALGHWRYTALMKTETIELLKNLNRQFYDDFASAFATSRGHTEPGLEKIMAQLQPGSDVLDLGCGQGRIAFILPPGCNYTGMDFSAALLDIARQRAEEAGISARFIVGDLLSETWPQAAGGTYDWIFLRAVLHHIPAYQYRKRILEQAAQLLKPGGRIAIANWQFLNIPRLRRRLCSWDEIGLTESDLEPGDYLLDWQRQGRGLRYVHLVDEAETRSLAVDLGLEIEDLFKADGHSNDLTLYALLSNFRH